MPGFLTGLYVQRLFQIPGCFRQNFARQAGDNPWAGPGPVSHLANVLTSGLPSGAFWFLLLFQAASAGFAILNSLCTGFEAPAALIPGKAP